MRAAFFLFTAFLAQAEVTLRVHLDRVIQSDYFGVNGVYHGFAFMPEQVERGMNDAGREREFSRVARMKLNIARTWYRPDWACGDSLATPPDWESQKMQAFYRWLAAMKERNVDVALQAGWWFTRDTYIGAAAPDRASDPERYARWVSDSLGEIVEKRGFRNVKYLILFTEPTSYNSGLVPPGETQWSYYVKMVRAIHARLVADGRRGVVKLVGPNNTSNGVHLKEAAAELNDVIDIYSGHAYNKAGYDDWFGVCRSMAQTIAATGKPLWLDELGKQDEAYRQKDDYGTYLAEIVAASINAGLQTSLQWLLFDQQYVAPLQKSDGRDAFHNGVHRWGVCKWPDDDVPDPTSCYPQWYAVSMMSRYLGGRGGTKAFATEGSADLRIAATSPGGRSLTLLVVNSSAAEQKFAVRLSRGVKSPVCRRLYRPGNVAPSPDARILPADRTFRKPGNRLRDTLPPRGVAIYTTIVE